MPGSGVGVGVDAWAWSCTSTVNSGCLTIPLVGWKYSKPTTALNNVLGRSIMNNINLVISWFYFIQSLVAGLVPNRVSFTLPLHHTLTVPSRPHVAMASLDGLASTPSTAP